MKTEAAVVSDRRFETVAGVGDAGRAAVNDRDYSYTITRICI